MQGFGPTPYLQLPGTAREALDFYQSVFGGEIRSWTYGEFDRADGPADAIAHGMLNGLVSLYAADAGADEDAFSSTGLYLSLLGTGDPEQSHQWFDALAGGGRILDPLQERGWNAWDGQLRDQFGVTWLIGYELSESS